MRFAALHELVEPGHGPQPDEHFGARGSTPPVSWRRQAVIAVLLIHEAPAAQPQPRGVHRPAQRGRRTDRRSASWCRGLQQALDQPWCSTNTTS